MIKNEQLVAKLEFYLGKLKTSSGDKNNRTRHCKTPETYAQIFQDIEEDEEMRDVLNVNIVFYKDMNYRWQYEIRKMYFDENNASFCLKIVENIYVENFGWLPVYKENSTFGYASNVFQEFYETKIDAQKACAVRLADLIEAQIDKLIELW